MFEKFKEIYLNKQKKRYIELTLAVKYEFIITKCLGTRGTVPVSAAKNACLTMTCINTSMRLTWKSTERKKG